MAEDQLLFVGQKAFIDKEDSVLILNDPKLGLDFPGGKIQVGEDNLEQSLKREVLEEANLNIEVGDPFTNWYIEFHPEHRNWGKKVYLVGFRCKYLSGEVKISDEHNKFNWVDKSDFKKFDDGSDYFRALEKYFLGT